MKRLVVLLARDSALDSATFREAMAPHAEKFSKACDSVGAACRLGYQSQPDPLALAAGDRVVIAVDALLEASLQSNGDIGELMSVVDRLALDTAGIVDQGSTSVLVGESHELLVDRGSVMLLLATRGLKSLPPGEFGNHWLNTHAPLALSLMTESDKQVQGYSQLHVDPELSAQARRISGFSDNHYDGVLQCTVEDIPTFLSIHANPEFDAIIYADEEHFVDRTSDFRGAFIDLA